MGYVITRNGLESKERFGNRHRCDVCSAAFYDLHNEDAECPACADNAEETEELPEEA